MANAEDTAGLLEGELVAGRYRLESRVGRGGMGVVYRAYDQEQRRECALKLLGRHVAGLGDTLRFKREFRAARRMQHPNCIRVFDLHESDGHLFFTMEYAPGGALRRRERMDPPRAAAVALQVLAALDHIHSRVIVHRDIKPSNVLLVDAQQPDAGVKLSDFGISRVADLDEPQDVGTLVGSFPYMAPESIIEGQVDVRSDLYSVGILLYELLTGEGPYGVPPGAPARDWLSAHTERFPAPLDADVPDALGRVVLRLLEKEPSSRYATAATAYDDIEKWFESASHAVSVPEHPALVRASHLATPRFVGRADEMDAIAQFVAGIDSEGPPRVLVVEGEAGLGKTRLLSQLIGLARRQDLAVEVGTCRPEVGPAYGPLHGMFAWLEAVLPTGGAQTQTATAPWDGAPATADDGELASERSTVAQKFRARSSEVAAGVASAVERTSRGWLSVRRAARHVTESVSDSLKSGFEERAARKWSYYRALADGLVRASQRAPLLILLEDAQWADAPTLELLGFLVRATSPAECGTGSARILFVVTHRPAPDHAALASFKEKARADEEVRELVLKPLALDETAELVGSMLTTGPSSELRRFTSSLVGAEGANPLLVQQMLHLLVASQRLVRHGGGWNLDAVDVEGSQLPVSIREAIGDRAGRFGATTKRMLAAAAVEGLEFTIGGLVAQTDLEESLLLDCLDEAIRGGFLDQVAGRRGVFRFAHDRFREAIYGHLPAAEAQRLHAHMVEYLEARHGDRPPHAALVAHHAVACGAHRKAVDFAVKGAAYAMKNHAFAQAADLYETAVREAVEASIALPDTMLESYGDACLQCGRYGRATAAYRDALERVQDPLARVELLRKEADAEYRAGRHEQAIRVLHDVLEAVDHGLPKRPHRVALALPLQLGVLCMHAVAPVVPRRVSPAKRDRVRVASRTTSRLAEGHYFEGNLVLGALCQAVSINTAARLGPSPELAVAYAQQGYLMTLYGLGLPGFRFIDRAQRIAEEHGSVLDRAWVATLRGLALGCRARPREQAEEYRRASVLLQSAKEPWRLRQMWATLGDALAFMGLADGATHVGDDLIGLSEELGDDRCRGWGHRLLGHAAWLRGDSERAEAFFRKSLDLAHAHNDLAGEVAVTGRLLKVLLVSEREEEAARVALRLSDQAARTWMRYWDMNVDEVFVAAAAMLALRQSLPRDLERALPRVRRRARLVHRQIEYGAPLYHAADGFWSLVRGRREKARKRLEDALRFAREHSLHGESRDIHLLATRVYSPASVDHAEHRSAAQELTERFRTSIGDSDRLQHAAAVGR